MKIDFNNVRRQSLHHLHALCEEWNAWKHQGADAEAVLEQMEDKLQDLRMAVVA